MEVTTDQRWLVAVMGTLTHLGLGTVYAWSFFQKPIAATYGWSNSETAWAFCLSILMLGITASWCGSKIEKFGARKLAVIGVVLYALGYIISSFALTFESLFLLYFGFGIVGGIGLGLAYVTPVAVVSRYFPRQTRIGYRNGGDGFRARCVGDVESPGTIFCRIF